MRRDLPVLAATVAMLVACSEQMPLAPTDKLVVTPALAVADGAHAGNPHFFWLPPLVVQPSYEGTFDERLRPTVRVCELAGAACGSVVASFTMSGATKTRIRVDPEKQQYIANWQTSEFRLSSRRTYRISVAVGTTQLGYIDVRDGDYTSPSGSRFTIGSTLPIKFRIEEGAVFALIPDLTNADHILHINENDPAIATVPMSDGEVGQYLASRDASGMPLRIVAFRKFALANPTEYDLVTYLPGGAPEQAILRTGERIAFNYRTPGRVGMVVAPANGQGAVTSFAFDHHAAVVLASNSSSRETQTQRASVHAVNGTAAVAATAPLPLTFLVNDPEGPVDDAFVNGDWNGNAFAAARVSAGTYVTYLAIEPSRLDQSSIQLACSEMQSALDDVCNFVSGPQLSPDFWAVAEASCLTLAAAFPPVLPVCGVPPMAAAACLARDACESFTMGIDKYVDLTKEPAITVGGEVSRYACHQAFNEAFPPGFQGPLVISTELVCPPRRMSYTLAGPTGPTSQFGVDDDYTIFLNGSPLRVDNDAQALAAQPLTFEAEIGDVIGVEGRDVFGTLLCYGFSPLWLYGPFEDGHSSDQQLVASVPQVCPLTPRPSPYVFLTTEFQIPLPGTR